MGFLFIIFFLILLFVFLLPSLLLSLISTVLSWFGLARRKNTDTNFHEDERVRFTRNMSGKKKNRNNKQGKIFDKDEGEYVDFEELK